MRPALTALGLAALFFGGGGYWAMTAPIGSAVIASGTISPEGQRRTIQHLEGGIIHEIRVKNGDTVEEGEILLVLEDTSALSDHQGQRARLLALQALRARLRAEEKGYRRVDWRDVPSMPERDSAIRGEARIFQTNQQSDDSQRQIYAKRIEQDEQQIHGLQVQLESQTRQLDLLTDEITMVVSLVRKGVLPKPDLLDLQRQEASLLGEKAANLSSIAQAEERIGETRLEMRALAITRRQEAAAQLSDVRAEIAELEARLSRTRDVLQRTVITAPIAGAVFNLQANTVGGVVRPGDDIVELVPQTEELLIDARVTLMDIDTVYPGLGAEVSLSALPQRNLPRLEAVVRQVSADRIQDEMSGEYFYEARVQIAPGQAVHAQIDDVLVPGMPADVMIFTGTRTFWEYLATPLMESIHRSFREQ